MMLKSGILALLGALSITNAAFATIQMQVPDACPKIAAIQSEGVSMAYELAPKIFFAFQKNAYSTNHTWYFAIGFFEADSNDVAVQKGNSFLNQLSESSQPFYDEEGYWVCNYNVVGTDLAAIAFYAEYPISPWQTKHLLKKLR